MCVKVSAQVKVYFYEDDYILWIGKRFHIHNQVIYDKCLFLLEKVKQYVITITGEQRIIKVFA